MVVIPIPDMIHKIAITIILSSSRAKKDVLTLVLLHSSSIKVGLQGLAHFKRPLRFYTSLSGSE